MDENVLNFHLGSLIRGENTTEDFDGPLTLILELLRKNKIAIRDIKIADILDQYLDYLDRMQRMDLEIASEFVQMASYLLLIKTKMMLFGDKSEVSELDQLIESLEKLQAKDYFESVKAVIPELEERSKEGMLFFTKRPEAFENEDGAGLEVSEIDLLSALLAVYLRENAKPSRGDTAIRPAYPRRVLFSVREKSRHIVSTLRGGPRTLSDIFTECGSRTEVVAAFLSILELCSFGSVSVAESDGGYVVSLVNGDIEEILEKISE